jgi:hypothetical protein
MNKKTLRGIFLSYIVMGSPVGAMQQEKLSSKSTPIIKSDDAIKIIRGEHELQEARKVATDLVRNLQEKRKSLQNISHEPQAFKQHTTTPVKNNSPVLSTVDQDATVEYIQAIPRLHVPSMLTATSDGNMTSRDITPRQDGHGQQQLRNFEQSNLITQGSFLDKEAIESIRAFKALLDSNQQQNNEQMKLLLEKKKRNHICRHQNYCYITCFIILLSVGLANAALSAAVLARQK